MYQTVTSGLLVLTANEYVCIVKLVAPSMCRSVAAHRDWWMHTPIWFCPLVWAKRLQHMLVHSALQIPCVTNGLLQGW